MKIGIVTVHDSSNYGSFLQAYALQRTLENMGHEVYFIRTREKSYIRGIFFSKSDIKPLLTHPGKLAALLRDDLIKYRAFKREWKVFKTIDDPKDVKLDRIILGSDEIWNVTAPVFRRPVFYGIGFDNVHTYGISVSMARKEHFDKFPELEEAIRKIGHVLVRDENTGKVVEEITGRETSMVADPTFLCDVSEFAKAAPGYKKINKKYILIYSYVFNENLKNNIIRFARENDLAIVSACIRHPWADIYVNGSPLSFCKLLEDAQYVVTTTFHGTVFSLLNHKRFVSEPFSPKVTDVLNKVELDKALVEVGTDYETFSSKLKSDYDYSVVDRNVLKWRERSLELLKKEID